MKDLLSADFQAAADIAELEGLAALFSADDDFSVDGRLMAFPKYVPMRSLSRFLAHGEVFKQALDVHGSVVECGVCNGSSLFTWAKLSSIFEPVNHLRRVIGFDTFAGFPSTSQVDGAAKGALRGASLQALQRAVEVYNINRPLAHIPKIELVLGDVCETVAHYLERNRHLVVSLLHLDVDLYEPTKAALQLLVPRMPKGAVICFDELNHSHWPGETVAVLETMGLPQLALKRFSFCPNISYAILG